MLVTDEVSPSYGYVPVRTSYGGYAPPSYGYAPAGTSYGGYAPPSYGYAPARTSHGGYASTDWWICLSQLEQQHHELDTPH